MFIHMACGRARYRCSSEMEYGKLPLLGSVLFWSRAALKWRNYFINRAKPVWIGRMFINQPTTSHVPTNGTVHVTISVPAHPCNLSYTRVSTHMISFVPLKRKNYLYGFVHLEHFLLFPTKTCNKLLV